MANFFPFEAILTFLTIINCIIQARAILMNGLQDKMLMVGESGNFSCSSNVSKEIHWYLDGKFMYAGTNFFKSYRDKFQMDINETTGTYTLVLLTAKSEDAGVYKCREDEGIGEESSANLTVLDSSLVCHSSMTPGGFVGPNTCSLQPDTMRFSCAVSFTGSHPPSLTWSSTNGKKLLNDTRCDNQLKRINCSLTLKADPLFDGSEFHCQIEATSGSQYKCSTETIKVQYFSLDHDLEPAKKKVNDEINCTAKSNRDLRFNWTTLQDNHKIFLSSNQTLVIRNGGLHWCNVAYRIRNVTCSTLVSVVHAENDNENSNAWAWILLAISLVSMIGITFGLLKWKQKRKKIWEKEREAFKVLLDRMDARLYETPTEVITYKEEPILIDKFQTKASEDSKNAVNGVAILGDELFTISIRDNKFDVYSISELDSEKFSHKRSVLVEGLKNPKDLVSCSDRNCLFIKDYHDSETYADIFRVCANGKVEQKWKINEDIGHISIGGKSNVIVPIWNGSKLLEYTCNGKLVREINISPEAKIKHLSQAILLNFGSFVLTHGDDDKTTEEEHRVCVIDRHGRLRKTFGSTPGHSENQVNLPCYLATDENGSIIVIDRNNHRLLLLSDQLDFKKELLHLKTEKEKEKLMFPWRMCLDIKRGLIFVGCNNILPHNAKAEGWIHVYSVIERKSV